MHHDLGGSNSAVAAVSERAVYLDGLTRARGVANVRHLGPEIRLQIGRRRHPEDDLVASAVEERIGPVRKPDAVRNACSVVVVEVGEPLVQHARRSHAAKTGRLLEATRDQDSRHRGRRDCGVSHAVLDHERVADKLGRVLGVDESHRLDPEHRIGGYLHADVGLGVGHLVKHPLVFDGDAVACAPAVHAHSVVAHWSLLPELVSPLDERGASLD